GRHGEVRVDRARGERDGAQRDGGCEDGGTDGGAAHGSPWGRCGWRPDLRGPGARDATSRDGENSPPVPSTAATRAGRVEARPPGDVGPGTTTAAPDRLAAHPPSSPAARAPTMLDEVRSPHVRIGVPREVRDGERLVAATPRTVERLRALGYEVVVEHDAGAGATFSDA